MARSSSGKPSVVLILLCIAVLHCHAQQISRLKRGDLLFHVAPSHNAITRVTPGMIDHVAVYLGHSQVIQAVSRGVVVTPLDSLRRQAGHYLVGRVRNLDRNASLTNARTFLGRHYDYLYLPDNADIYCSELVQKSFVDNHGQPIFTTIPMSFHDDTGQITDFWIKFYAKYNMSVPEGQPGTNPGEMSRHPSVKILGQLKK